MDDEKERERTSFRPASKARKFYLVLLFRDFSHPESLGAVSRNKLKHNAPENAPKAPENIFVGRSKMMEIKRANDSFTIAHQAQKSEAETAQ